MRIRADQIQIGDRLQGKTVTFAAPHRNECAFLRFADATFCYMPNWLEVEIVRPEPTITVTIEITPEESDHAKQFAGQLPDETHPSYRIMGKLGRALREQENPE